MDGWKIRRAVDLQEDSPPVERLRALATLSSRQAHDFEIVVLDGGMPADLTGMQPWLSMILPGRASLQKAGGQCAGQRGICDAAEDRLRRAGRRVDYPVADGRGRAKRRSRFYGCVIRVMEDSTDTIIDEEKGDSVAYRAVGAV